MLSRKIGQSCRALGHRWCRRPKGNARKRTTEKHTWIFEGDKLTIKGETKSREHSFDLNPSKSPKTIDVRDRHGDVTGHGIYKLEADTIMIAIAMPKFNRPAEFATRKDSSFVVIVLK